MYLIKKLKAKTKHLWNGLDTVCRLYSTGGLNPENHVQVPDSDLPLCTMCDRKDKAFKGIKWN